MAPLHRFAFRRLPYHFLWGWFLLVGWRCATPPAVEVLIRNGVIVDGTGSAAYRGDVAISQGRIVHIGRLNSLSAAMVLDAAGAFLAPGFIDLQRRSLQAVFEDSLLQRTVEQGITTVLLRSRAGDGREIWPVSAYVYRFERDPLPVNVAVLVSHHTLRHVALQDGDYERLASAEEVAAMELLLERSLREGAVGLDVDLAVGSAAFASHEELLHLLVRLRRAGGLAVIDLRDPLRDLWPSLQEVYTLHRQARVPILVGRVRPAYRGAWLHTARWQQFTEDSLFFCLTPFTDWVGPITDLVPQHEHFNWREIRRSLINIGGARRILLHRLPSAPQLQGRSLADLAQQYDVSEIRAFMEVVKDHDARVAITAYPQEALRQWLAHARFLPVSDPMTSGGEPLRPAVAQYLQSVLSDSLLSVADAVYKLTGLPAGLLGLEERGTLRVGAAADMVIFRLVPADTLAFRRTVALQVETVLVNGEVTVHRGRWIGRRPGRVLRRPPEATQPASQMLSSW